CGSGGRVGMICGTRTARSLLPELGLHMAETMKGAYLRGNSTVEMREIPISQPGHGGAVADEKAWPHVRLGYPLHLPRAPGEGPGELSGIRRWTRTGSTVPDAPPNCRRFREGDRVIVHHISGCGVCNDCRRGYRISCRSTYRR